MTVYFFFFLELKDFKLSFSPTHLLSVCQINFYTEGTFWFLLSFWNFVNTLGPFTWYKLRALKLSCTFSIFISIRNNIYKCKNIWKTKSTKSIVMFEANNEYKTEFFPPLQNHSLSSIWTSPTYNSVLPSVQRIYIIQSSSKKHCIV